MLFDEQQLYIDGKKYNASTGEVFETVNPATQETLAKVQIASHKDVNEAVVSSQQGFKKWSAMTGTQRGRILKKAADILRSRNDELAKLEVLDTGKPISEAYCVDIQSGADCIEYYAGLAPTICGEYHKFTNAFAEVHREPLGVCAGIGAWNYPIQIACWKSAIALACGNSMIFKPAELTPLSAIKLAEIYTEAGLPDGVFNVVQGAGSVGQMLSLHPGIAKISLTGEVETGKRVMADAATTLKQVTLEMGGKSPVIVFEDADFENAISGALMANFYTQGEVCSNGTRVFVHESLHDNFVSALVERTKKLQIGDPLDNQTQIGALISKEHTQKVLNYIELGRSEGAVCEVGGTRAQVHACPEGNFVKPTIFTKCTDDMRIVKEEIFGPVMSVLSFKTEDEVVERANGTEFGLAAGFFTKDLARAHRVAGKLEAGIVWVNNYNITPVEVPFGGYKSSGIGRENGISAVEHYTQRKTVYFEMGDVDSAF